MSNSVSKPIIEFKNVTKKFNLQKHKTFKEFFPNFLLKRKIYDGFTALKNINFEVKQGEVLGIIGPNGSGKSTILKLIAGVMSPTSGRILVKGKVSPLIELGAGFHSELTGKENIYLNGSILGLKQKEIDKCYKEIVDFAGLWKFIDQPVKYYSSGMYMRLGFSVAVHVKPKILLIDEILSVGDSEFQTKCFAKMEEFKKQNITIIYVSHSLDTVANFCQRVIYLNQSKIVKIGEPKEVIDIYNEGVKIN